MYSDSFPFNCIICGKKEGGHYLQPIKDNLLKTNLCFSCNFWQNKVKIKNKSNTVRVDGKHYQIGSKEPDTPSQFRGFGGRKFNIEFNDGRVESTNNLWCQGSIPERWQEQLPNNAKFLKG